MGVFIAGVCLLCVFASVYLYYRALKRIEYVPRKPDWER